MYEALPETAQGEEGRMMKEDKLWTLGEVTDYVRVTEKTVHRWIDSGDLPAYKIGGQWRVKESDLEGFMESSRNGATQKT